MHARWHHRTGRRPGTRQSRRVRIAAAGAVIALVALAIPGLAATFPCPAGDVACLIAAINIANSDPDADTIVLEVGAYTLTAVDNDTDGANGLPSITGPVTIKGAGGALTFIQRDPRLGTVPLMAPLFRILHVAGSGRLALEDLTVRNGTLFFFMPGIMGGGIFNRGEAEIANVTITNNQVVGPEAHGGSAGGIANLGILKLTGCRVEKNSADGSGGGIRNQGALNISRSTVLGNVAHDDGGGIDNQSGMATITDSTIEANRTGLQGAGIANHASGELTVTGSTIARNRLAVPFSEDGSGGGISNIFGTVRVNNSTIAGNSVDGGFQGGGGIDNLLEGRVELRNTIVAHNTVVGAFGPPDCLGSVNSLGNNLVGDLFGCDIALLASDLTGDPGLDPFADDGTPGNGHFPLLETSQAVDAGDPASCRPTDQLGHSRIDGDRDGTVVCDIGAIEFAPGPIDVSNLLDLAPLVTAFDASPVPGGPAGTFSIKATFTNRSSIPIHDPVFKVAQLSGVNLLLNADGGPGQAGASLTPDVGPDAVLSPGESFTTEFIIGLQARASFTFVVEALGVPGL